MSPFTPHRFRNGLSGLTLLETPVRSDIYLGDPEKYKGPSVDVIERQPEAPAKKRGCFSRAWYYVKSAYVTSIVATVLPSAPRDDEKYLYVHLNRWGLVAFEIFATLAIGASTWLFIKSGPAFYWYAVWAFMLAMFCYPAWALLSFRKGFDLEAHKGYLEQFPVTEKAAPTIDIFLPVCGEEIEILENTWSYVRRLEYPLGKVAVYVLDDKADESVALLAHRFGFNYIVRPDRPHLKKAGNIRYAFAQTSGDYYAIFDADFCPRSDFLLELVPVCLANPKIAIVQTPQYFRSLKEQSWVEQAAGPVQEYFYRLVQTLRGSWGATVCCGSNALYKREALAEIGGAAEVESSEDMFTGVLMMDRGWQVVYVPVILACGVCPSTIRSFFAQQARWCSGSVYMLTSKEFWNTKLSWQQKMCFAFGWCYYLTQALGLILNPIPGPLLLWVAPQMVKYYFFFYSIPGLLYTLVVTPLWAKSRYPPIKVQYTNIIVAYACMSTFLTAMFGRGEGNWVSSGANKKAKNNRYRNMRILAWIITTLHYGNLIAAVTYRLLTGFPYYHVIPLLCYDALWLFFAHRFLIGS